MINEFAFIKEIKDQFPLRNPHILGIGDDAARIENDSLVCTDAVVDGSHFIRGKADLSDIAYKSMTINVSDLCAMGGYPQYALITLGLPQDTSRKELNALIEGWKAATEQFSFDIIGGDTVSSALMFISVTMIGTPFNGIFTRSGARAGDLIYVSGTLGDSRMGLEMILDSLKYELRNPEYFYARHYAPLPRMELTRYLAKNCNINSCIDISDGMGDDLLKLVHASQKGFFLEMNEIPLARDEIGNNIELDQDYFYDLALNGGEDYELLFTTPDELDAQKIFEHTGTRITPVGRITEESCSIKYFGKDMDMETTIKKYQHFEKQE